VTIASLPMYDWPEMHAETDAEWAQIRAAMPELDLPAALTRPDDRPGFLNDHWRDPALVFSQCCWGPLNVGMIRHLLPLAQPDYGPYLGGRGPFYRSAMVMRDTGETPPVMAVPATSGAAFPSQPLKGQRFAFNDTESKSGYRGLAVDLGGDPADFAAALVQSGSHRQSVRMIADGRADVAVIDCRSWALAQRFEPVAAALRVVGWTSERMGIVYVTSRATDPGTALRLQTMLLAQGCLPAPQGETV
jgi:hypothetical protein